MRLCEPPMQTDIVTEYARAKAISLALLGQSGATAGTTLKITVAKK